MPKIKAKEPIKFPLHIYEGNKLEQLGALYEDWKSCTKCSLSDTRAHDTIVFGDGNPDAKVLIIGEAPGEDEASSGLPFIGQSGKLLNQLLAITSDNTNIQELAEWYSKAPHTKTNEKDFHAAVNEWRASEFFITNVVGCRPPDNRTLTPKEIEVCWERVWNIIYTVDPWLIITVGKTALQAVLKRKSVDITRVRGSVFDAEYDGRIGKMKYTIIPVLHPSYLLRKADWKVKGGDFDKTVKDFHMALSMYDKMREQNLGTPLPSRLESQWTKPTTS